MLAAIRAVPNAPQLRQGNSNRKSVPLTIETAHACDFVVGIQTPSQRHMHWRAQKRINDGQKAAGTKSATDWATAIEWRKPKRCVVHLCRVSGGTLDEDNLRTALKFVRDSVGRAFGFADDRESASLDWRYSQRVQRGVFGVEVTVTGEA